MSKILHAVVFSRAMLVLCLSVAILLAAGCVPPLPGGVLPAALPVDATEIPVSETIDAAPVIATEVAAPASEAATEPPPAATSEPPTATKAATAEAATAEAATATEPPPTATTEPSTVTPEAPKATSEPPTAIEPPPVPTEPLPTATTEPAAKPESTSPQITVKSQALNVRAGPGTNFPVLATIKQGDQHAATGRSADSSWLQICCFDDAPGWVSAALVELNQAPSELNVPAEMPEPPAVSAPAAPAGGSARGVLLYSVANVDANRWELWQYDFGAGSSSFLKEWRTEVAFSPDYKQVVYFGWPNAVGDKYGIYAANADLSNEWLVIPGGLYPSFSPGGDRLVAQGGEQMYLFNTDGSGLHAIDVGEYPTWGPVDNWIAHRGCYGPDCGLWLTHADSGERRRLTTGGGDGQPAWSPNGQQIVYISKDDGNFEIYRINRDGSDKVRLTSDEHSDGLPVWSPDGAWIAFRSDRDGAWAIYVMRPDGSDVRKLVDAAVLPLWFFEKMAWRP